MAELMASIFVECRPSPSDICIREDLFLFPPLFAPVAQRQQSHDWLATTNQYQHEWQRRFLLQPRIWIRRKYDRRRSNTQSHWTGNPIVKRPIGRCCYPTDHWSHHHQQQPRPRKHMYTGGAGNGHVPISVCCHFFFAAQTKEQEQEQESE